MSNARAMRMNRRHLLKLGGAALLSAGVSGRLYAAPAGGPRFLLVFLRGGYDSTNLLIPYSQQLLLRGTTQHRDRQARPGLEYRRAGAGCRLGAGAGGARHHRRAVSAQRQVAFVPFAGTDDLSRSHFETQDSIELGQPIGGARDYRSGFLGRLSDTLMRRRSAALRRLPSRMRCRCAFEGPTHGAESVVEECRQAALR